jgi:hypothetical protein
MLNTNSPNIKIQDTHVKQARMILQPCVEAFDADFTDSKTDFSDLSDGDIIRNYHFISGYENCLADD